MWIRKPELWARKMSYTACGSSVGVLGLTRSAMVSIEFSSLSLSLFDAFETLRCWQLLRI